MEKKISFFIYKKEQLSLIVLQLVNPALPANQTFFIQVNALNLEFLNHVENIPVGLTSSLIKI